MSKKETVVVVEEEPHHKRHHSEIEQHPSPPPAPPFPERAVAPSGESLEPPSSMPTSAPPSVTPLAIPPLLKKTPTSINQIIPATLGDKGTHFTGPVVSGPQPGANMAAGAALSAMALQVDYSMGATFSLPLQFPKDCFLLWALPIVYTAFSGGTGDSTFALGTTANGVDILAATNMGALHAVAIKPVIATIPLPSDAVPGQIYFTVQNGTNTAGLGIVLLIYARSALKWS